ncbi:SDR family oxidoreductase [Microbulbifer hainanensis]|uniref:SDR family oxidoreductase n=1 Tax=Microbulbifer hainanensis TaxID=2735675 RepID=UPI00186930B0|nr:SDR family oxidoreductase [Microbulbifer hainanensis]
MQLRDKVIIVTGAASGIGLAMSKRFIEEGAARVYLADLNDQQLSAAAASLGDRASTQVCDVTSEEQIQALVARVITEQGRVDLFCCNAGIISIDNPLTATDEQWQRALGVNLMGHVYSARAALPYMLERGEGYFLNTASAAGLLNQPCTTTYAVTKHAAVGFAESLAIEFGDRGIKVSCLCPQAVNTPMVTAGEDEGIKDGGVAGVNGIMEPEELCDFVVQGLAQESFLILPHREVQKYMQNKAADYDRWLLGMRRLKNTMMAEA